MKKLKISKKLQNTIFDYFIKILMEEGISVSIEHEECLEVAIRDNFTSVLHQIRENGDLCQEVWGGELLLDAKYCGVEDAKSIKTPLKDIFSLELGVGHHPDESEKTVKHLFTTRDALRKVLEQYDKEIEKLGR